MFLVSKSSLAQSNEVLERMTLKSPLVGFDSQISKDIEVVECGSIYGCFVPLD